MSYDELSPVVREAAERKLTERQLLVLKFRMSGYSYVRISVILGVSEATVRGHYRRALQILEPHLKEAA